LFKIGLLERREFEAGEIERLLGAAARSIVDARIALISTETRFDAAYRAIMQVGLAALAARAIT